MKSILTFSMNKVAAMLIIIAILFGGGLYSASSLKLENMPDVSFPYLFITTNYSASPEDVMTQISKPIEDKVANTAGIESVESDSSDGSSMVIIQFKQGVDIDQKKQDVDSLIQSLSLPAAASRPYVSTFGYASIPAYYLAIDAKDGMTQADLDVLFKQELKPGFESIAGIDHMDIIGARQTTLDIELQANALNAYGFAPSDINNALQAALSDGSVGAIKVEGNTQTVRVSGEINSLYSLNHLVLTTLKGQSLELQDVARIKAVTRSQFISRVDGHPAIGINLYKTKEANAVDFSNKTNALLKKWNQAYPDMNFLKIYDSADDVRQSIDGLLREGLIGVALAALIILLFLRNLRMTAIVLVSIPLSVLITLVLMHYLGLTLNIMSLGGIFIAVGRIVDDSIVVIENIFTNLKKAEERKQSVILLAVKQVSMAITSSTFVTVGVFLPIAFVTGIVGEFFRPFALTVASALLASLLVALTVIPLMAKLLVLRERKKETHQEEKTGKLTEGYGRVLSWCLNNRIKTLMISAILFIVTIIGTIPAIPVSFMPDSEANRQMNFTVKLPYDTALESTDAEAGRSEALLREAKNDKGVPLFTFVQTLVGYAGSDQPVPYSYQIYTEVTPGADANEVKERYARLILDDLPKGSNVNTGSLAGGDGGLNTIDYSYVISGDNQQSLEQAASMVKERLKSNPNLKNIKDSLGDAKSQVQVTVDSSKAHAFGLSTSSIQLAVQSWINEEKLGDLRLDNTLYTTRIGLASADKDSLEQLGKIPLHAANGDVIFLNEVTKINKVPSPVNLHRSKQKQVVTISASITSPDKSAVSSEVSKDLSTLDLPDGVSTAIEGVSSDIGDSFSQLFAAMGVAIAIVYLVMVLCFGNASTPFAILFSLPLAVIGGLLGLALTGESINVTSLIGFMMLIGIVVTNAIVLLDRAQQLIHEGVSTRAALLEAGLVRLRPIVMTAGATIVAMVPLAIGLSSHGTLISKGLAIVVIGGLATSTILTLVVVPVIYELLESLRNRIARLFRRPIGRREEREDHLNL